VKTIHKYPIPANGDFSLELPVDAEILTVKPQKSQPCIWVLLDTREPKYKRNFSWIRTGEPIEHRGLVYIETLLSNDGDRVSHLFELVVKIDYSKLEHLLAAKKWREADNETFDILANICGLEGYYVSTVKIENLPCQALYAIDQLWSKYSNGRFGFSAQYGIWQSLRGTQDTKIVDRNDELWGSFCDRVGWQGRMWGDLIFTLKAPIGHLPARIATMEMGPGPLLYPEVYANLYSRVEACQL
jgi:hypothetical protein